MDSQGIRVGTVLGAPVLLRPSWFVVVGIVTVAFAPRVTVRVPSADGGQAYLVAGAFALILFGSVFLHELAHAVTARAVGSPPAFIVLDLWGGHTAFSAELLTPWRSIVVAAAGPVTNVLLAGIGITLRPLATPDGVGDLLLFALVWSNGFVAAFNALPGLPLDGGRVLEGVVWALRGDRAAGTSAAGWGGRLIAVVVGGYALLEPLAAGRRPDPFLVVSLLGIAVLLWRGATQTIRLAEVRRRTSRMTARSLLVPAAAVPAGTTPEGARAVAGADRDADLVLLGQDGSPVALLDRSALQAATGDQVDTAARTVPPQAVLPEDLAGQPLLDRIQAQPHPEYVVVDADGTVVGVLRWDDVADRLAGREPRRRASGGRLPGWRSNAGH